MNTVISVGLTGQARPIRLHEDAYGALRAYLDQASSRLGDDPDAGEVIDDLERSIGERLAGRAGPDDRILAATDVTAVLDEVGSVDTGTAAPGTPGITSATGPRPRRRRLYRIREGQQIAGVCNGLAVYSDVRVDWVRTIFILLTVVTAGLFLLVYLVLMFLLPVIDTRADWVAAMDGADGPGAS